MSHSGLTVVKILFARIYRAMRVLSFKMWHSNKLISSYTFFTVIFTLAESDDIIITHA